MVHILAVAPNTQGFLAFIATLVKRRLEEETPPRPPVSEHVGSTAPPGVGKCRHAYEDGGIGGLTQWLGSATRLLLADTTLEHLQSPLLGGAIRTADLCDYVDQAVRLAPELNIVEVCTPESVYQALSDARECPFRRIEEIRRSAPGLVLRATLNAATCIGHTTAPRSSLGVAVDELVDAGIDIIRIVDPFNDPSRLKAAVTAAALSDALIEGAVTVGGTLHPTMAQSHIERVIGVAQTLEQHGAHSIVLEDRCGVVRPVGAYTLVRAIRREINAPIWIRVSESGGYGLATLIAAVEAGAIGVDTSMPSVSGVGIEPDALTLINALSDTERRPELSPLSLAALDEHLERICTLAGGWHPPGRVPPDAPERGITPHVLDLVVARCGGAELVSKDHALAAAEQARSALGKPAMIPPAVQAVVSLAIQMIEDDTAAGTLIDRARADDPEGLLDSMGNLRDGGFPEGTIEIQPPTNRDELLNLLWDDVASKFFEHQARFGHLELLPSVPLRYGLGAGDHLRGIFDGDPQEVLVVSVDEKKQRAMIELNGKRLELRLSS